MQIAEGMTQTKKLHVVCRVASVDTHRPLLLSECIILSTDNWYTSDYLEVRKQLCLKYMFQKRFETIKGEFWFGWGYLLIRIHVSIENEICTNLSKLPSLSLNVKFSVLFGQKEKIKVLFMHCVISPDRRQSKTLLTIDEHG